MSLYRGPAWSLIASHYGDRRARRSQALLMDHVDDGLQILSWLAASDDTCAAWCLHPLLQSDDDLRAHWRRAERTSMSAQALVLAIEYRHVANAYLLQRTIASIADIGLSPLAEVNQMLVADKVQNYRDFLRYHAGTHPRSTALDVYFRNWLERLEVSSHRFDEWCAALGARTTQADR